VKRIKVALAAGLLAFSTSFVAGNSGSTAHVAYLGFDRNEYPGDGSLKLPRGRFSFVGFWLNNPPSASSNSWTGKRRVVQELGKRFYPANVARILRKSLALNSKTPSYCSTQGSQWKNNLKPFG
jgi:hypothetical protein